MWSMEDYYPGWPVDAGTTSGSYSDDGEPKGLLHTTEGKTYAGARAAFVKNNSWPHATITFERGVVEGRSHVPLSRPARSLRNLPGGVQTNRDLVAQLEIVGTCDVRNRESWGQQYVEDWPTAYLDGIAAWMRWAEAQLGIPTVCTVTFLPYPDSYGNNGVRLTGSEFDAYSGWLGHQHAAENDHGDPGLVAMAYLLGGSPPPTPTPPPEDDIVRATFTRHPSSLQVYVAGVGIEPRPVTLFTHAEDHTHREGIVLNDPPTDSRELIADAAGEQRWVMHVADGSLFGLPVKPAVDVDALAVALAPLLDDVDGAPTASDVAEAVRVALAPDFDAIPFEVVAEIAD